MPTLRLRQPAPRRHRLPRLGDPPVAEAVGDVQHLPPGRERPAVPPLVRVDRHQERPLLVGGVAAGEVRPGPPGTAAGPDADFPGSDYSDEERAFLVAIDTYKRRHRRPFLVG